VILWPKSFKNCTADSLIGPKVSNRGVNFGGRGDTSPPRIWSGEKNSLKLGQNYAYRNPKLLQLLGDFVPRPPTEASPLDPTGGLLSPDPCTERPPRILYQVYATGFQSYRLEHVGLLLLLLLMMIVLCEGIVTRRRRRETGGRFVSYQTIRTL